MKSFWDQDLPLLLLAPPAWGKTHLIKEWMKESDAFWIYVTPLRALGSETYVSLRNDIETVFSSEEKITDEFLRKKSGCIIGTPESLIAQHVFDRLPSKVRIVVDEVHLFYHWGETFRPAMQECLREIIMSEASICFLTATLSDSMREFLCFDLSQAFSHLLVVDEGNYQMKNLPRKTRRMNQEQMKRKILREVLAVTSGTSLIFCQYRQEVDQWVAFFKQIHLDCLGCKGGEVKDFVTKLTAKNLPPRVIVSTTCLSHGVNLPRLNHVFITYDVLDPDFKLQMSTRGGRRGEKFELAQVSVRWRDTFLSLWQDMINRFHLLFFEEEQECLQKAFSFKKSPIRSAISS